MNKLIKRHTISFKNAFNGLIWALRTQPNYRIHIFLSVLAIFAGFYFQIKDYQWLAILILIILGLTVETVNTAIEATTDAIDNQWREDIKIAKDVSAGAMLLVAVGAIFLAIIIFLPKIFY